MPPRTLLTALSVKSAKPKEKTYRISDEKGLYLEVTAKGQKYWRLKYRFNSKEKRLAIGVYPEVSLSEAREAREEARKLLGEGVDPSQAKQAKKYELRASESDVYEVVAREWLAKEIPHWSATHRERTERIIEKDLLPYLGNRVMKEISAPELLGVLRRIEARGAIETAHRGRTISSQIFRYGIACGHCERDPAADLRGALQKQIKTHFSAITEPKKVGWLLNTIDAYQGSTQVRAALRLAPLVFVRPGELRHAEWSEIDFETATWSIPAEKMKMREPHIVPLSRQALQILKDLYPLTGTAKYIFYTRSKNKPLSENGINAALRYLGVGREQMTAHGFRAMARTLLDEALNYRIEYIEHQLAHTVKDHNGRAYNRTKHLVERRKMMQHWADYLDSLRSGAVG
ncbi:DNA integration/recombination/inversion protein [gamma proteobacterium HTCC5015]|nr:DNA integration/recombination/inversion protein [gamma proteobacterium HTCC5015]